MSMSDPKAPVVPQSDGGGPPPPPAHPFSELAAVLDQVYDGLTVILTAAGPPGGFSKLDLAANEARVLVVRAAITLRRVVRIYRSAAAVGQ